jgi:hypothetical protein
MCLRLNVEFLNEYFEKLVIVQLFKKLPALYGTKRSTSSEELATTNHPKPVL